MSHDQSTVNPYRKVSTATWTDRKVLNLTPLQPSGQALFLMLMVGPQTTHIPGVQPVGRLAFAEMLCWEAEAFDEAFAEAFREGLVKADWKARLIFVPNAIKHNLPQSPNVVKSWGAMWARIPECDLKTEAWSALHAALEGLGRSFAEAFKSACPLKNQDLPGGSEEDQEKTTDKPSPKATGKPTDNQKAVNSKQKEIPPIPPTGGRKRSRQTAEEPEGFDRFWAAYPRKVGKDAARKAFDKRCPDEELLLKMLAAIAVQAKSAQWQRDGGQFIPHPSTWLNDGRWEDETPAGRAAMTGSPTLAPDDPLRAKAAALPPDWWRIAGFDSKYDAEASRCNWMNYTEFRDRQRVVVPAEGALA